MRKGKIHRKSEISTILLVCLEKNNNTTYHLKKVTFKERVLRDIPPVPNLQKREMDELGNPGNQRNCECDEKFNDFFNIFFNIFIFFLALYPYVWLLLDKRFARKICGICTNLMIRPREDQPT